MLAEAELKTAKAAAQADERAVLTKQLAQVRAELRTAKATYEKLRRQIRTGERELAGLQSQVDGLGVQLALHNQTRPAAADFLPEDEECRVWRDTQDRLIAQRSEAIALRDRVMNAMPDRLACAKFEGNFGVIANLARSETNLIRRLRGERLGSGLEGGVFRVL
jgi:soluble cytochrome b562